MEGPAESRDQKARIHTREPPPARDRADSHISELEGTRGPRATTMTEAANGKARISAGERTAGEFPHSLPGLRTEVVLFDNSDQMVQSLGSHDEALRFIETQFPAVDFHVRGNELSISGPAADVPRIMRLLNEVRGLVARGTVITPAVLQQLVSLAAQPVAAEPGGRPHPQHPLQPRQDHPAQDAEPEELCGRHRRQHRDLRDRTGRYRQDLPGHGQGRPGAAAEGSQPHHPDPSGRGGGGAARLPARHPQRQDRPLPAPALRRPARHDGPRVDPAADGRRHHRSGARWPTCAAARSTTPSSSWTRPRTPRRNR